MDNIWIGRFPGICGEAPSRFDSIIDLTAEMSAPHVAGNWQSIPNLDLATPQADALFQAANAIENFRGSGNILVCCALGYSRSAAAIATWLLVTKRVANTRDAIALISKAHPHIVLNKEQQTAIGDAAKPRQGQRHG
ncbi:MAG: hypothetical protein GY943_36195 [Chloroflexi bacterium]|nr:hypothetical protein [Chloroflexota bacterium]